MLWNVLRWCKYPRAFLLSKAGLDTENFLSKELLFCELVEARDSGLCWAHAAADPRLWHCWLERDVLKKWAWAAESGAGFNSHYPHLGLNVRKFEHCHHLTGSKSDGFFGLFPFTTKNNSHTKAGREEWHHLQKKLPFFCPKGCFDFQLHLR